MNRKALPKLCFTSAKAQEAKERREKQKRARTSNEVAGAPDYTIAKMRADLDSYAENRSGVKYPEEVLKLLNDPREDRQLLLPSNQAKKHEVAKAVARWRLMAPAVCEAAHAFTASSSSALENQIAQEKSTTSRHTAARERLQNTGRLPAMPLKGEDRVNSDAAPSDSPVKSLETWLEANRNIPRAGKGEGLRGLSYVGPERRSEIPVDIRTIGPVEAGNLSRISRSLRASASSGAIGGRSAQMNAARGYRRAAEIEFLFEERDSAKAMDTSKSPWLDPGREPPPASIGNADAWRRGAHGPQMPPRTQPSQPLRQKNGARDNTAPGGSSGRGRRPALCSCCSEPRVRGHVDVCAHTNKVCSSCQREKGEIRPPSS